MLPRDHFAGALKEGCQIMGIPVDGPDKRRDVLQAIGTDVVRRLMGADHWLRVMDARHPDMAETGLVIDDVRFPDEVAWCRAHGFLVVRLMISPTLQARRAVALGHYPDLATARAGLARSGAHESETALDGLDESVWDLVLDAAGDPGAQAKQVLSAWMAQERKER